jgi:hypothetical protein
MSALHFPPSPYREPSDDHLPDTPFHEYAATPSNRIAGWSGDKQRSFLQAVAEGLTVDQACRLVGLSKQSAYAFRLSAKGGHFALGWQAALLRSRDLLADELMARAYHGTVEVITRPDGSEVERHRHDNRLGMAMLTRLDRMADRAARETTHAAARLVAQEFDQYLDLVERDAGPARAGLFLAGRIEASEDDLAPVRVLARADSWLRSHTDLAAPIADLDPAAREQWSGTDWTRAEVAGLVAIAPTHAEASQRNQHFPDAAPVAPGDDEPVWWDMAEEGWRTRFPPPEDFLGSEDGEFGEEDYARSLTLDEEEAVEAPMRAEVAARRVVETAARDAWFGVAGAPPASGPAPGSALVPAPASTPAPDEGTAAEMPAIDSA